MTFGERIAEAVERFGPLCVGIDPHEHLLESWGLPATAAGAEAFGLEVVAAATGRAGVVKPQVAFFERYGAVGYAALERVLDAARTAGLVVIADAKRGDLGTSVAAYGAAWLTPGAPLEADAMTVSAFQGLGSLDGLLATAERHGKGAFVLCATSNPEARATQLRTGEDGLTLAAAIERDVAEWNGARPGPASLGLVVGATVSPSDFRLRLDTGAPILAPGFGHQGAALGDARRLFPREALVLASASRSLTTTREGVATAIASAQRELAA